ncbi:hypothetical protein PI126_g24476, partial [Phytophthora idaei]
ATRTPTRATAAVAAAVLQIRTPIPVTAAAIRPIPTKLETGSSFICPDS